MVVIIVVVWEYNVRKDNVLRGFIRAQSYIGDDDSRCENADLLERLVNLLSCLLIAIRVFRPAGVFGFTYRRHESIR